MPFDKNLWGNPTKKGEKAMLKEAAASSGQSMAQYLIQAVNERAGKQLLTPSDK
ncbi:MAG: DUF1778 domain-containing protein [Oscillospiraceae bacterium]|nr:DUF1778 domain-containing protein [Oscillospiraceae bacterium]